MWPFKKKEEVIDFKRTEPKCEKHGNIWDECIGFNFPASPELNIKLCLKCFREKLIEIGVCEVKEI